MTEDDRGEEPRGAGVGDAMPPTSTQANSVGSAWDRRQIRIYEWLRADAPIVAPVYEGLVRMASDVGFPGRVWFMAHALRDIRNRLPDEIAGPVKHSRTEYSDLASVICEYWIEDGHSISGSVSFVDADEASVDGPRSVEISAPLFSAVRDLVEGHEAIGPRKAANARRLLEALSGQVVPDYVVDRWVSSTTRAERFAHLRHKPLSAEKVREFEEIFDACEQALAAMANRSYENMDELDEILANANS